MTKEEAKDKATSLWGPDAWAVEFAMARAYGKPPFEVGNNDGAKGVGFSWEEAFFNASNKVPK